ncbi:vacuolar protein sorting-associated protein 16 homolog isoform X1 [Rhineura floridana]|uniref:vacuolar protein sorting-associated protein 16 homolog isoform X1 n=1 Tax=Rhineura floridana TaxID=261503 RepID=UPI002AC80440|nr:vacuolar protein sorting-associated protein 16 homolog isoform X1 [Rhineura floridana]
MGVEGGSAWRQEESCWGERPQETRPSTDCYTANWDPLGEEAYYRKLDVYIMGWNLREDLRDCLVAAAPCGGPIALLKTKKEKSPSSRPPLEICFASGVLLASIPWKNCPAVHLGLTTSKDLLCIQEDGSVLIYSLFCEFKRRFSMGNMHTQDLILANVCLVHQISRLAF